MNAEQVLIEVLDAHGVAPTVVPRIIEEFKARCDQPLDGKFSGYVWRNRDKRVEEQFVVFVPRDEMLVGVLRYYETACQQRCGQEQLDAVQRLRARVAEWQKKNPTKLPDAELGECK
jgi:hypothetical protein